MNTVILPYTSRTDSFSIWLDAVKKCKADLSDTRLILLRSNVADEAIFYDHLKQAEDTFGAVHQELRMRGEPNDLKSEVEWWHYCVATTWHKMPMKEDIMYADTHWLPTDKRWHTDMIERMRISKASAIAYGVKPVEKKDPIKVFGPICLAPSFWGESRIFRRYNPGFNLHSKLGYEMKVYGCILNKDEFCFTHFSKVKTEDVVDVEDAPKPAKKAAKKAARKKRAKKKTAKKAAKKTAKEKEAVEESKESSLDELKEKAVSNLQPPAAEE